MLLLMMTPEHRLLNSKTKFYNFERFLPNRLRLVKLDLTWSPERELVFFVTRLISDNNSNCVL